jgi:outer membrane protein assembly factor BamB
MRVFNTSLIRATALGFLASASVGGSVGFADWTHWRGPAGNGVSQETSLPDDFKLGEPGKNNLLWVAPHGCRSTPLVHNGRVFFNSHTGSQPVNEQESVVCVDLETGKTLWQYKFNIFMTDIVSNRVGWTNLVIDPATGNVYCHGTQGYLICLNRDGKVLWQRSTTEEYGRVSGYGGRLSSPIIDGDLVILGINCAVWGKYGRGGCRFAAFNKNTGEHVWWGSTGFRVLDSFQSVPLVAEINQQRLLIGGGGDGGIHAFKIGTGEKVWSHLFCQGSVNTSPVIDGSMIYIAHGDVSPEEGNIQGRVLCLDASQVTDGKPKVVWQKDGLKIKFASPILDKGRLILNDEDGRLYCLDAKTGDEIWKFKYGGGNNIRCSPILADGKIYVGDSRGRFYIIKDDPKKPKALKSVNFVSKDPKGEPYPAEMDGNASISNGRLFFGTGTELYCIGTGKSTPSPVTSTASSKPTLGKPSFLQVVPGEITVAPGETVSFRARLFDQNGNFIKETPAKWELGAMETYETVPGLPPAPAITPPPLKGTVTADGKLTVAAEVQGQFGLVVATAEGVSGTGRVRQTPKLPYSQDFEKVPPNAIPGGWSNSQAKFAVREFEGQKILVKTATNPSPLVARASAFIGPPSWTDYTIQADMLSTKVKGLQADMGVVANRYYFFLSGETKQLRLVSWESLPRIDKSLQMDWKENAWYTLKLTVAQKGDKSLVKAKIWERGKDEPAVWTLEVEDPTPNREGAAALYANVPAGSIGGPTDPGSEVYFDNLKVTPNPK